MLLTFSLIKTLLGEIGCLGCKVIYPLMLCLEKYFFNNTFSYRTPKVAASDLCTFLLQDLKNFLSFEDDKSKKFLCDCVTRGTLYHTIGHQLLPTWPCYRDCYGFERALFTLRRFLPCTPSCCFQGFPGRRQLNLKISRASCWSSKHGPVLTICLNHSM